MSQQDDQIKQLEESNQELKRQIELQAKQIEALKSTSAQSDGEKFAPHSGGGWAIVKPPSNVEHETVKVWPAKRNDYYAYPTREQAEWEHRATQVRRKLQRICAVLGPAGEGEQGYYCVTTPPRWDKRIFSTLFARHEDAKKAQQILGDDLKYLDWNNSPEARDAREGRE